MYIHCLISGLPFEQQDDMSLFVQRVGGWFSIKRETVEYYIPERYAFMLYMYDPKLVRQSLLDYVI